MLWAGTGLIWTVTGGVPRSALLGRSAEAAETAFTFAQISDSHIGFNHDPNTDVAATLAAGIAELRSLPHAPTLLLHTGDVSHLSRAGQFDTAAEIISTAGLDTHYVPGEHDVLDDGTAPFIARFQGRERQGTAGGACYSFDQAGVHFVGLNNVSDLKAGGMGNLGAAQLAWLADDLRDRASSQPIVMFAHVPLWTVYADWGWGTSDGEQALALLRRFGSVTVLNGHIHQVMQKVEGSVAFHTARSTAFPQPAPGTAAGPGPLKVAPGRLRSLLGVAEVAVVPGQDRLAIIDTPLAG
jgi:3',5'-cyclic AMP phosphodiesterase CpdA